MKLNLWVGVLPASPWWAWAMVAALTTLVMVALVVIFPGEIFGALRVWIGSRTYNHCFLILPIALFMIWTRRERVSNAEIAIARPAVLAIAAMSVLWSGFAILGIMEAQQFAVLTSAQLILLGTLGTRLYRKLIAPFLYLYFLVPSGDFLTVPLLDFTAGFVLNGLHLLSIPVYSNGAVIDVRSGTFAIEEACAGLRFLIATVALGVFYACQIYRGIFKRSVFIALCIIVPIIGNGLRALGIVVLSEVSDNAAAVETDHITYGFVFFGMILALLIFTGRIFADAPEPHGVPETGGPDSLERSGVLVLALNGAICLMAASVGLGSLALLDRVSATPLPEKPPVVNKAWYIAADGAPPWKPLIHGAARTFFDTRSDGRHTVYRFVGVFPPTGPASKMVRADNRVFDEKTWQYAARSPVFLTVQNKRTPLDATIIVSGSRRRLAVLFYAANGEVSANIGKVKLRQFAAHFTDPTCASGLFVLATDFDEGEQPAAILQRYLDAMQTPATYLCSERARGLR